MEEVHFNYISARNAGYKINIAKINYNSYDPLELWVKENFPDVEVTRPTIDTDLSLLDRRTLLTVNGFVYPTVFSNDKLYIRDATKNMLKSRVNHVGILSFNRLNNDLSKYSITEDMITPDGNYSLYDKCIITFPSDIQTPIIIIGGYVQLEEPNIFYRISDRSFALSLSKLPYVERLYETERYRNIFSELEIPVSPNNEFMIDGNVVRSDLVVMRYLTLNNSFLVNVPVSTIVADKQYLNNTKLPGEMYVDFIPEYPIVGGYGKLIEYSRHKGPENRYLIKCLDNYYNNHLFSKRDKGDLAVYNSHRVVGNSYNLANAFMLDMHASI